MLRALSEYEIGELKTLLPFHQALLRTPQWANAETCRDLIEDRQWLKALAFPSRAPVGELADEKLEQEYTVEVSGKRFDVRVIGPPGLNGAAGAGARRAGRRGALAVRRLAVAAPATRSSLRCRARS